MSNSFGAIPVLPLNNMQLHNNVARQTPTAPYKPQLHPNIYERISTAKKAAGLEEEDNFYTDEDIVNYAPRGWPNIASRQTYFGNHNSHRGFEPLTHYLLTSYELKLSVIENELDEMNCEDVKEGGEPLWSLPFDRQQFITRCRQGVGHLPPQCSGSNLDEIDRATQRENMTMSARSLLNEYLQLLLLQRDIKKLPRVSRSAHEAHFNMAQRDQGLNDQACTFMRYIDDFVSTEPDAFFRRFESLLYYSNDRRFMKPLKYLCRFFSRSTLPSSIPPDGPHMTYSLRPPRLFIKAFLAIGSLLLSLLPIALLFLETNWSRAEYLAVVVISSAIFALVILAFEPRTVPMLVSLNAYFAVLSTFLSNLPM
ncbi:hypothetical protein F4813DRAFT_233035 [Daldinia decipiens]|uniref:uncharacterized protein n=1 Tax=Daldinia decipiens TaxID=326647 RepID=UPI0020C58D04|nr:uncharacterized protein F4813DRAFT_233035 [Daldinia decipiens]KAI1654061.1 hypothetical protein F4813DRAFT_233035 [Daldinia decipiens]